MFKRLLLLLLFCTPVLAKQEQHNLSKKERGELVQEGSIYEQKKDYTKAIEIYQKLHDDDRLNYEYMYKLGVLYYRIDDLPQSERYFKMILKWYGTDIEAKIWLGRIYNREKKYQLAESYVEPVFRQHPDYIEVGELLARVYNAQGKRKEAIAVLNRLAQEQPENPNFHTQIGNLYASNEQYDKAYKQYKMAWEDSGKRTTYLDRMLGVRGYAKPHLDLLASYSQEREIDLVSQLLTTEINTWFTSARYTYPVNNHMRMYVQGGYSPEQQYNKISQRNNYYVNNYWNTIGADFQYKNYFRLKGQSNLKWGKNFQENNIFPFDSNWVWEPLLSARFAFWKIAYSAAIYKESFVGRDFSDVVAFYVRKKSVMNALTIRLHNGKTILGGEGTLSNYYGSRFNKLKDFNAFIIQRLDHYPIKFIFEYKYLFGTFKQVDREYFSYRARYRHFGTIRAYYPWGARGRIEARYTFKWQKLREFVNVAEEISINNARPPQELLLNILRADEIEGLITYNLRDHLRFTFSTQFYEDSNKYKTISGKLGLDYYF